MNSTNKLAAKMIAAVLSLNYAAAQTSKLVTLNVVATDHHGKPVTDLQASDLRLVDGAAPQQISSLSVNENKTPLPIVVLFDMVDLDLQQRGEAANNFKESLAKLPFSVPIYLYLLAPTGQVFGVVPISATPFAVGSGAQDIGPVLDKALDKVAGPRLPDMKVTYLRSQKIYEALYAVSDEMASKPGRKQLLWISRGLPSSVHLFNGWHDFKPQLAALAARFNAADTALYSLDPSLTLGTLNRDGLFILSQGTGGRAIAGSDLNKAVAQLRQDGLSSYRVVYSPTIPPTQTGKVREVKVICERKDVRLDTSAMYILSNGGGL